MTPAQKFDKAITIIDTASIDINDQAQELQTLLEEEGYEISYEEKMELHQLNGWLEQNYSAVAYLVEVFT